MDNRYNQYHRHNSVEFYLADHIPDVEECRLLILKVMEQTVRDYLSLYRPNTTHDEILWNTAAGFIFDDDYRLKWGEQELTPEELLAIVDIDIDWFRQRVKQKVKEIHGKAYPQEQYGRDSRRF